MNFTRVLTNFTWAQAQEFLSVDTPLAHLERIIRRSVQNCRIDNWQEKETNLAQA